ncbi:MAG TPA: penicillin-binding protein 2 [Candidatus Eremiobacteraceae bacterium]|nr:penicillin-binding protein 2 [Candidatus Eremiobacteraceae bacterium]
MKRRLLTVAYAFIVIFLILAAQEARVQLVQRTAILERPGDPRRAQSIQYRGELLDAAALPLARSIGSRRVYDAGTTLAQIVGYSSSIYGESGLEAALDPILAPRSSGADNATGFASLFGRKEKSPQARGGQVVLTLRRDIAQVVDKALPQGIRGAAIVMDPRTGAILAVVNRPTFDPNSLTADWNKLRVRSDAPLLDRSLDGLYPPGSTFKMFTASAALDSGALTLDDHFQDPGHFDIGGFSLHNAEKEVTGYQSFTGAFALSSNVDFAQIGVRLGVDTFYEYLHRYHLGEDVGLAVPITKDEVPQQSTVSDSELAQMAFGQAGLAVTPLRMALIGATIANGGLLMRPTLVKEIRTPGRAPIRSTPIAWTRPISQQTADELRDMMIAVVKYGTGTAAKLSNVTVAGKTGTATHPGGLPDAWFVCFAPAQSPRLVVAVIVEDAGYGGVVAAPVARTIMANALPLYQ